jgi:hypothetical protein
MWGCEGAGEYLTMGRRALLLLPLRRRVRRTTETAIAMPRPGSKYGDIRTVTSASDGKEEITGKEKREAEVGVGVGVDVGVEVGEAEAPSLTGVGV